MIAADPLESFSFVAWRSAMQRKRSIARDSRTGGGGEEQPFNLAARIAMEQTFAFGRSSGAASSLGRALSQPVFNASTPVMDASLQAASRHLLSTADVAGPTMPLVTHAQPKGRLLELQIKDDSMKHRVVSIRMAGTGPLIRQLRFRRPSLTSDCTSATIREASCHCDLSLPPASRS